MASVTVSKLPGHTYTMQVGDGRHTLVSDEHVEDGGEDLGPSPYELMLSALGSCTAITLLMYASQKQWPVDDVSVSLDQHKVFVRESQEFSAEERAAAGPNDRADLIRFEVSVRGALDEAQLTRLLEIANRCPVHRTLDAKPRIVSAIKHLS